jgi:hypothetical protein
MIQITIEAYKPDPRYDSDLSPGRWRWLVVHGSTTSGVEATLLDAWRQANAAVGYTTPLLPFYGVSNYNKMEARAQAAEAERDAALAEVASLRAERDAAADSRRVVCDCGTSASLEVDEDGVCLSCGTDVIVCADLHSAEVVSGLRDEKDELRANYSDLHPRINAQRYRAEDAENEVARLRTLIAEAADDLPLHPEGAHLTPAEADAEAVRVALLAALRGEA